MVDSTIQNSQGNGATIQNNNVTPKIEQGAVTTNIKGSQGDGTTVQNDNNTPENKQGIITVVIKDPQGNEVGQFIAENGKNIAELAAMHGIDIPVSCGAGVCGVCLCKVEGENDIVKSDAFNSPLMPLKSDENGNPEEVLTCIAGFNPEKFNDGQDHTVILQRTY